MLRFPRLSFVLVGMLLATAASAGEEAGAEGGGAGKDLDEFKIKAEQVFEFAQAPVVTRDGDRVTVTFESKGFCDATVAVEDGDGKIVRHLASGVLGPKAPAPFQPNSKKQTIVWDGKDDAGQYIDDKDSHVLRVSLGLKPQLERTLFWSPHKRTGFLPLFGATPEGVYVYQGRGVDSVQLFDHQGNYVRAVYPFPNAKLREVQGLNWHAFPQGYERPLKEGHYQNTLLTCGDPGMTGMSAMGMAVRGGQLALAYDKLNRLGTGGTSGGLPLTGPSTSMRIEEGRMKDSLRVLGPSSMAFSPDGKTLYMTGYMHAPAMWGSAGGSMPAVLKMDYAKDDAPVPFAGSRDLDQYGSGANQFTLPTSVACDAEGRVYVSDFMNDRVQVFDAGGKLLKTIPTKLPAKVLVHQKTGAIYVFSWSAFGVPADVARKMEKLFKDKKFAGDPTLTVFSPMPEPKQLESGWFPLGPAQDSGTMRKGALYQVELDSWSDEPVFWIAGRKGEVTKEDEVLLAKLTSLNGPEGWRDGGIRLVGKKDGKWAALREFGKDAAEKIVRVNPGRWNLQQLMVNPRSGKLYLGEGLSGCLNKNFNELLEIDPESGAIKAVPLPVDALDMCFDLAGNAYLRTTDLVMRFDSKAWREIPWDYGETQSVMSGAGGGGRPAEVLGALALPARSSVCYHQGGMSVSPKGHLAIACHDRSNSLAGNDRIARPEKEVFHGKPYRPQLYPGRQSSSTSCCIHVWDKHGQLVHEDAVPGLSQIDGVFIDRDDNLYVMATPTRVLDGKKYFDPVSETLMKFKPRQGKIVSVKDAPVELDKDAYPARPQDLNGRWVEGAEWFYGGVGFAGFNQYKASSGCACWWSRFSLDYYARSFAPEPFQFGVAVLDSNGNLITRTGRPGNVDDGKPLVAEGGPPTTNAIGGDEVALFHADFVGTDSDKRLFIADLGNGCIRSVKLDYHAQARIALKDVKDGE